MSWHHPTHRVTTYGLVVIAGLAAALMIGRPEPAILAAPFAVFLFAAMTADRPQLPSVTSRVERDRALEGDEVVLTIRTQPSGFELLPLLPNGVSVVRAEVIGATARFVVRFDRWGVFDLGAVAVGANDPLHAWRAEAVLRAPLKVRVHPALDRLPSDVVAAAELQPFVGQHVSRARGDGFEFADLRPYRSGDRARAVNWRATARRGTTWVNERHPDRASEVVLMLDTFGVSEPDRRASLELAVRAVAAIAQTYSVAHDRIGLMTFGGYLRWLRPGGGRTQVMRIVEAILDTDALLTDVWKDVNRVPVGAIPPRSLLLAVTPLQSDFELNTLADLRARGFDVAVIVMPAPWDDGDSHPIVALGRRVDRLAQDARRLQLERIGVAVSIASHSLEASLREVDACRRRMPRVRV